MLASQKRYGESRVRCLQDQYNEGELDHCRFITSFFILPNARVIIRSPMTPLEYEKCYDDFMDGDDVYYVSEHRGLMEILRVREHFFQITFCLFPISITRFQN